MRGSHRSSSIRWRSMIAPFAGASGRLLRRSATSLRAIFTIVILCQLAACSRGKPPSSATAPASGSDAAAIATTSELRIVSLSPAITRTLIDFSVHRSIVGRTPHCESIDPAVPIVGDLFNLDYERLIAVKPTHVLVQPPAAGLDPKLEQLAAERGWKLGSWKLNDRDDIETLVRDLPG